METTSTINGEHFYVEGTLPPPHLWKVAIIGSRTSTGYGESLASTLARDLTATGLVAVVSGMAYGIDIAAHRGARGGAVDLGLHPGIAVMARGLDAVYPSVHDGFARDMLDAGGCWVSRFPPGTVPTRSNFLARNVDLVTIADAVVVVEGGTRSGTINTVTTALRSEVPVFAYPGPVTSAVSYVPNQLIADRQAMALTGHSDVGTILRRLTAQYPWHLES